MRRGWGRGRGHGDCEEIPRLICCFLYVDRGTGEFWGWVEGKERDEVRRG